MANSGVSIKGGVGIDAVHRLRLHVAQIHPDWPADSFERAGTFSFLVQTGNLEEHVFAHSSMAPRTVYVQALTRALNMPGPPTELGMFTSIRGGKLIKDNALWALTETLLADMDAIAVGVDSVLSTSTHTNQS